MCCLTISKIPAADESVRHHYPSASVSDELTLSEIISGFFLHSLILCLSIPTGEPQAAPLICLSRALAELLGLAPGEIAHSLPVSVKGFESPILTFSHSCTPVVHLSQNAFFLLSCDSDKITHMVPSCCLFAPRQAACTAMVSCAA